MGILKSSQYGGRVKQLEASLALIQGISTQIRYQASPLNDLLHRMADREDMANLPFVGVCSQRMNQGMDFPKAWTGSLKDTAKGGYLKEGDYNILRAFGRGLGTTDVEGQLANCRLHTQLIEEALQKARGERDGLGKLYSTLGVLAGVGAAVLFA